MAKGNFGERLKREREMREVSLKEVTVATRIGSRFLEALENEDWSKLPGGVFNRGFVRAIARYLGMNEEDLLAEYDEARAEQAPEPVPAVEARIAVPPKWMFALTLLALAVVVAGLVAAGVYGWRRYSAHRRAKQSAAISLRLAHPARSGWDLPASQVRLFLPDARLGRESSRLFRGIAGN